jgi:hypothetical protein
MDYEQAIALLKNIVKFSDVKGQKHLDFVLVNADDRELYQEAIILVRSTVTDGDKTQVELNKDLGLI